MNLKDDYLERCDRFFGRMGRWIYDHRWRMWIIATILLSVAIYFAAQTRIDNSLTAFFDESDPSYGSYIDYQRDFGSDEVAYLLYHAPDAPHGLFNIDIMCKVLHLTEALEDEVPFVREVTSLANVEFLEVDGDFLEIHELAIDFPDTQEALLERRDRMMKKPFYIGSLMDKDATHGAIILEMSRTSSDPMDRLRFDPEGGDDLGNLYPQVSNTKINEILDRPEYEGIVFYRSGDVPMNSAYNEIINSEMGTLTLVTFAIVGIVSLVCFRMRIAGLLGPLVVVSLGLVFTLGFMGAMGFSIDLLFLIAPTLLTAIGVAQSVHLISEFRLCRNSGLSPREAMGHTLAHVGVPCMLAALTTSVGFLAMSVSKLKAIAEMAVFLAVGVMGTFVLTITVLLCILSVGHNRPERNRPTAPRVGGPLSRFLTWVIKANVNHPNQILVVSALIFVLAFVGMAKLSVGFNFLEEFKPRVEFRQHTEYIENVMGGILNLVYIFDAGKPDGIKDADLLRRLADLQKKADADPLVKKTYSIVDILKDLNQSFHADDPAYYTLPQDDALIAQYLLLYEMAGGKELEDYVTGDYARTVLELRVEMTASEKIERLIRDLDATLNRGTASADHVQTTGIGLLWIKICDYIASSQISGYLLAFCMIAFLMCVVFRSVKVGLLSMVPNLSPIVLCLGLMGWQGLHLDYFRLLLATVAIGIAVDDTIHLVARMRKEFLRCGDYDAALTNSMNSVGHALVITSIILMLAFAAFLFSQMVVLSSFGILLILTILTALVADLFLMPSLLLVFKPFGSPETVKVRMADFETEMG